MTACVHKCTTEQLHLGWLHCKAVKVTLLNKGKVESTKKGDKETKGRELKMEEP